MTGIFSFKLSDDKIRYKLYFCGIKFCAPRPSYAIKLMLNPFYRYKKENRDITTLPKATGQIRNMQLANLEILKEFDKVCKKNNLQYWLDYGTLLGAVRHKGYIPWDDDIDVSMLRDDFEKLTKIFEDEVENKDLYLKHHFNEKGMYLLKISHKKCPYLCIDVFIYDYCKKFTYDEEKIVYTQNLQKLRQEFINKIEYKDGLDLYKKYEPLRTKISESFDNDTDQKDLIYGIEFGHQPYIRNNWVMSYDEILPIKEIEFEGYKFPCVNNPDKHLTEVFGNYMNYPKKIDFGHGGYVKLSLKDRAVIKKLINKKKEKK